MNFTLTVQRTNYYPSGKYAGYMVERHENLTTEQVAETLKQNGYIGITAAYLSRVISNRKPRRLAPIKGTNSTVNIQLIPS